jgi:hypothetical protein
VAPIYSERYSVKEITPSELSGKFGGLNQVFLTLGICSAASLQFLMYADLGSLLWWQFSFIVLIALVLMYIACLVYILPDTPHWYYEQGQKERAKSLMRRIILNPAAVVGKHFEIKEEVRLNTESTQGILTAIRSA